MSLPDEKKMSLRLMHKLASMRNRHEELVWRASDRALTAGQHLLREEWGTPREFLAVLEASGERFSPLEKYVLFSDYVEEWSLA